MQTPYEFAMSLPAGRSISFFPAIGDDGTHTLLHVTTTHKPSELEKRTLLGDAYGTLTALEQVRLGRRMAVECGYIA